MSIHPVGKSRSDLGRVLILNDCMSIHLDGRSCSDLDGVLILNDPSARSGDTINNLKPGDVGYLKALRSAQTGDPNLAEKQAKRAAEQSAAAEKAAVDKVGLGILVRRVIDPICDHSFIQLSTALYGDELRLGVPATSFILCETPRLLS